MREIKFRAWYNTIKKMVFIDLSLGDNLGLNSFIKDKDSFVMQFIGLKDKDGTDIYEGDIVKYSNHNCYLLIEWQGSGWGYDIIKQQQKNTGYDIRLYRSDESFKVIGNIYENPEFSK